ncbi:hypothetical protein PG995_007113 [Apiospora arundinis]
MARDSGSATNLAKISQRTAAQRRVLHNNQRPIVRPLADYR